MTVEALLERLRRERDQINSAIAFIEAHSARNGERAKARAIVKMVSGPSKPPKAKMGRPKKKVHWTQTPEGRASISAHMKKWHRKVKSGGQDT
jgi:hypothetical protein